MLLTWRPWKYNTARAREITDQLWRISHGDDTHRVSPFRPDGPEPPLRCRRFAYGYALDGSQCPSYLVWPQRDGQSYTLLDTSTTDTLALNHDFYQELLHSSSRYNATREGERKRPSSGLARVAAYPKPPKQRKPSASGTSFSDWIGGTCYADTLQVWFPAHWAPVVLQQLQQKEDSYRAENPSWMDQEVAPVDIRKQWQEARANRRMQFKVGNYRDGSWESNIRMLTGTIKVDWIQLPVELYLAALPTLKQGVIAGVFRQKGAAPWGIKGTWLVLTC